MSDFQQNEKPVFIVAAARTDSVKYYPENFRGLSDLLADAVVQIPANILQKVDTVHITHRYPTPLDLDFDREAFLRQTNLPPGDILRVFRDDRAILGGIDVIKKVVADLSNGEKSTALIVGGEVFEPSVVSHLERHRPTITLLEEPIDEKLTERHQYQLQERRSLLNKFGGLPSKDREIGLTPLSAHSLVADAFFRDYSFTLEEMSELMCCISTHVEKYAYLNPRSYQHHKRDESGKGMDRINRDKYKRREQRDRKWPFTLLDLCSISNGAGALVLSNDPDYFVHKVRVCACVVNKEHANQSLLDRPRICQFDSNREAWRSIKEILHLDLRRPKPGSKPIFLLELFDIYAFQIAMTLIEMGMYQSPRDILKDFTKGYFDPAPDINKPGEFREISSSCGVILNPSGGSKDGHPNGGYALVKAVECFFQLTELSTEGSLSLPYQEIDFAFVHAMSGVGNTVGILALKKSQ